MASALAVPSWFPALKQDLKEIEEAANAYTNNSMEIEKQARIDGDKSTLEAANAYTNNSMTSSSSKMAKTVIKYINGRIGKQKKERMIEYGRIIRSANNYTNSMVRALEGKMSSAISSVAAISSIPYVNNNVFSYGVGFASYNGRKAIAFGVQYKLNETLDLKINASLDDVNESVVGLGIAGGW